MKNLVKQKIIYVDRKINPSDPENDFWSYFTFKAFLKFLSSTQSDSPSASAPPNTPTRGRQSSTPHADADPRSIHTPMSSAAVFPSASVGFLHFLLVSHSTSPLPTSSSACTRSPRQTHRNTSKAHLTSNISDPLLPRHQQNTSLKPTLYNTWSTSLQTYLPFLLFSHLTSPPRSRQDHGLSRSYPSTTEIALSRSSHMTHPRSISLFSIYLSLSLNFWSLSLPPSLNLTELWSLTNGVVLIFVFLSLYIEILYYKICLVAKKIWETSRRIAFS